MLKRLTKDDLTEIEHQVATWRRDKYITASLAIGVIEKLLAELRYMRRAMDVIQRNTKKGGILYGFLTRALNGTLET